ncbi:MAG: methyltransferase domain-containing protein [Thermomicrobiales bacterium]
MRHLGSANTSTPRAIEDGELRTLLACPACHGGLVFAPDHIRCRDCDTRYAIVEGIPLMLADAPLADATTSEADSPTRGLDAHKQRQIEFFNEEDAEFEITRPHGTARLYQWFLGEKFRRGVRALPAELAGRTALTVCGGSGMDAEYLARAGAAVIASDLSLGAARRTRERARRYGLPITVIVADVERLPFADGAVDLVYVHDGLHHLEQPTLGLAEMARVAGRAVSITEPARAAATAVAVRLGLAQQVEEAGNRVERLEPAAIATLLRARGFEVVHAERYAMLYRHRPGPIFAALSAPGLFALTRLGWRAANRLLGRIGNKLTVQAIRLPATDATDRQDGR